MSSKEIPVAGIGPGSQPPEGDGRALSYISMPNDMATYQPPAVPDPQAVAHLEGARHAMRWLPDRVEYRVWRGGPYAESMGLLLLIPVISMAVYVRKAKKAKSGK